MKREIPAKTIRIGTILLFFLFVAIGLATNLAPGTLSSFGFGDIVLICPLGALEVMIAGRTVIPLALTSLLCVIVIGVVLGKIFCAWICPVPLARLFSFKKGKYGSGVLAEVPRQPKSSLLPSVFHSEKRIKPRIDSRFLVLAGTLATTAFFGFPVFCLVCPVGLIFATIIGLWRLIGFNEPSWLLILFPAMLFLELVVFKKWCHKICPLGAIFSLVSSLNTAFRPRVDKEKCLRTSQNAECTHCADICFEQINLHNANSSRPLSECTKCRDCASVCPAGAIGFIKKKQPSD